MDFNELFCDVLEGFIMIAKTLLCLIIIASVLFGIFSAILVAVGKLSFLWWYIPCWIVDLIVIAGAVGSSK